MTWVNYPGVESEAIWILDADYYRPDTCGNRWWVEGP